MEENTPEVNAPVIDQARLASLIKEIEARQSLPMAITAGFVTSIVGAIIWAAVTVITEYQIGWMAVAVGFLVGYSVRYLGKGITPTFGYIGAAFALLGCLSGNFLSIVGFISIHEELGYFETLGLIDYSMIPELMTSTFQIMDLLFYGIATYEGYKFGFQKLSEEQLIQSV